MTQSFQVRLAAALSVTLLVALALQVAAAGAPFSTKPISRPHAPDDGPIAVFLTPGRDDVTGPRAFAVRAVVAARQPDRRQAFVVAGERIEGRNAGQIRRVKIAVDDVVIADVGAGQCRQQVVIDEVFDLGEMADGQHTLTLTAYQGAGRHTRQTTASTTFTLDQQR